MSERSAWLDDQCGADRELRDEVAELLAAGESVGGRFERVVGQAWASFLEGRSAVRATGVADDIVVEDSQETEVEGGAGPRGSPVKQEALLSGRSLGYIRVHEQLGEGGMGRVYRGTDERLGRQVAVKLLRSEWTFDPDMAARLRREARLLSQLEHPVVCRIYDVLETAEGTGLVLELIEGQLISDLIGSIDRNQAMHWALDLAEAIAAAHGAGIVHRDLKPGNVMVTEAGELKILDFGVARSILAVDTPVSPLDRPASAAIDATRTGEIHGTLRYMSPEQIRGDEASPAADIFALGLVLFELVEGRPAYDGDCSRQLVLDVRDGRVPAVRLIGDGLGELIGRMTSVAPGSRPSAVDVAERLRFLCAAPQRRRRRWMRGLALVTLALFGLVMAWQAWRVSQEASRALEALRRAQKETERANQQAETARQLTGLIASVFDSSDPWAPDPTGSSSGRGTGFEALLRQAVEKIRVGSLEDPEVRARLLLEIADRALGVELIGLAEETLSEALSLRLALVGPDHPGVAECLVKLADLSFEHSHLAEALERSRRAVEILENTPDPNVETLVSAFDSLVPILLESGEVGEAEVIARRRVEATSQHWEEGSSEALEGRYYLGLTLSLVALHNTDVDRLAESERVLTSILAPIQETYGADHPALGMTLSALGRVSRIGGRSQQAESLMRQAVENLEASLNEGSRQILYVHNGVGMALREQGRLNEADSHYRWLVAAHEARVGPDHFDLMDPLGEWSQVRLLLGDPRGAEAMARRGILLGKTQLPKEHWELCEIETELARALVSQERWFEAEQILRRVLLKNRGPAGGFVAIKARRVLAELYDSWNKPGKAKAVRDAEPSLSTCRLLAERDS